MVDLWARSTGHPTPSVSVFVYRSSGWAILEVEGEMDLLAVPAVSHAVDPAARHVVFDLRGVTFIDGCGLGILLDSRWRAVRSGGEVRLVAPSRTTHRLLLLTGKDREFRQFDSVAAAVSSPFVADPVGVSRD